MTERLRRRAYRCLREQQRNHGEHAIQPVHDEHVESIRLWRNEQIDVLRQSGPLTRAEQVAYYERVVWPSMDDPRPSQILFALSHAGAIVGYGGLVHISWADRRAELSFLLDPVAAQDPSSYELHFRAHIALMLQVAFDDLGFHRVFTETFDVRSHHIAILEAMGFVREGTMRDHAFVAGRFVDSLIHGYVNEASHAPG